MSSAAEKARLRMSKFQQEQEDEEEEILASAAQYEQEQRESQMRQFGGNDFGHDIEKMMQGFGQGSEGLKMPIFADLQGENTDDM